MAIIEERPWNWNGVTPRRAPPTSEEIKQAREDSNRKWEARQKEENEKVLIELAKSPVGPTIESPFGKLGQLAPEPKVEGEEQPYKMNRRCRQFL